MYPVSPYFESIERKKKIKILGVLFCFLTVLIALNFDDSAYQNLLGFGICFALFAIANKAYKIVTFIMIVIFAIEAPNVKKNLILGLYCTLYALGKNIYQLFGIRHRSVLHLRNKIELYGLVTAGFLIISINLYYREQREKNYLHGI